MICCAAPDKWRRSSTAPPDPPTDGGLLTTAETYIARLAPLPEDDTATKAAKAAMTAAFLAHELPADFITPLQADVQAIRDEYALREKNREKGVRSTGAVGPLLKEANDIITMLNAIMHNKYSRDPAKLRAWKSASHVERAHQREKKPEPPAPDPAPTLTPPA